MKLSFQSEQAEYPAALQIQIAVQVAPGPWPNVPVGSEGPTPSTTSVPLGVGGTVATVVGGVGLVVVVVVAVVVVTTAVVVVIVGIGFVVSVGRIFAAVVPDFRKEDERRSNGSTKDDTSDDNRPDGDRHGSLALLVVGSV
jgi:hypothetical protein